MKLHQILFCLSLGLFLATAYHTSAKENIPNREKRANDQIAIKVVPWGPTQAIVDKTKQRVERSVAVQKELAGTHYRLLEISYIENENKSRSSQPPTRFRIIFYDYTNDRTISAEGDFNGKVPLAVRQEFFQPNPSDEEFAEAVQVLQSDKRLGGKLRSGSIRTFAPMPPITVLSGTTERMINVGLKGSGDSDPDEVVSVSLRRGEVIRYDERAPATSAAGNDACGIAGAEQASTARGTAGQYQLNVTQDSMPLWDMIVVRPAVSSGTLASGIEVREVRFKGKSVLERGHAPVLNVEYLPRPGEGSCGPFRDWQYAEDSFNVPTQGAVYPNGPIGGIVVLGEGQIPTTSIESGVDSGNFQGVAIYRQDNEIVLITEMDAGWYRYIMEWRFASDGTIRPRYGFGAITNSCVCYRHQHHIYWRFDFDIVKTANRVFQVERGRKFLQPITSELTRAKSLQTNRSLLIQNSNGNEAYMLVPNKTDGSAIFKNPESGAISTFGRSDLWVLRYKGVAGGTNLQNEIDDGWDTTSGECTTAGGVCINIDKFINNESVVDQDIVIWYGAHYMHDDGPERLNQNRSPDILTDSHVVGPDIRPIRW